MRWTVGGEQIEYDRNLATLTTNLIAVKCHINITISTPVAKYCKMDITDVHLRTLMIEFEYLRVLLLCF